jgi:multifunctional 2-oxoglutarate metabolism enzyme
LLSEYAAMGFEYGYSVASPEALVLWEAQFGDFANGAQTIIDEFITSGQAKWTQQSGVVLLLPHGYEGQGPDHSSARLERFLQLAAEDAFTVAQPSTPGNYFHMLRQQALGELHRPLIVMTPKSMLRNKLAVSDPSDLTQGSWKPVFGDLTIEDPSQVSSILLCSGKIRWELVNARSQAGKDGQVAIIALERLYPLPVKDLVRQLKRFEGVEELRWVQDEPLNQGAWPFMALNLPQRLADAEPGRTWRLTKVTRTESSAPSVGSAAVHMQQHRVLMEAAFK